MAEEYTKLVERYIVKKSIDKINTLLGIPLNSWGQDPDIELANPSYISKLLELLNREDFDDDDRFYTMSFLFASFDDAVGQGSKIDTYWKQTVVELEKNIDLYATTLSYWSCYDAEDLNDLDQMFYITELVRDVWDKHKHNYL